MKKLLMISALFGLAGSGALSIRDAEAACDAWSASTTAPATDTYCTCGSARGGASYIPAKNGQVGYAAGRIYSGNNSLNDIQVKVRCYNDAGNRYGDYASTWDDGNYAYRGCPTTQPLATKAWCRIRYD